MRPLDKPPLDMAEFVALAVDSLLIQAFGPYCATCERRLPDEAWIWHKKRAEVLVTPSDWSPASPRPVFADRSEWPHLLLLCRNCMQAATTSSRPSIELLYPDDAVTFSLDGKSPFRYVRKTVTVRTTERDGSVSEDRRELVVVEGEGDRASETIRFFRLNGASYDDSGPTLDVTFAERMSQADERVAQRTAVFDTAGSAAETMLSRDDLRGVVAGLVRQLAGAAGFWSVWATAFSERTRSRDIIRDAMNPNDRVRFPFASPWRGATPDRPFPGTRAGVL